MCFTYHLQPQMHLVRLVYWQVPAWPDVVQACPTVEHMPELKQTPPHDGVVGP